MSDKIDIESPNAALMRVLKFSSKDLDANRDGDMTEGQKRRVKQKAFGWAVAGWGAVLFLAFIITVINAPKDAIVRLFLIICIVLLTIWIFNYQRNTFKALKQGNVEAVHGMLRTNAPYDNRYQWIEVLGIQFLLDKAVYKVFLTGETYTIYYMPEHNLTILSAEYHEPPVSPPLLKPRRIANIQRRPDEGADHKAEATAYYTQTKDAPAQVMPRVIATTRKLTKQTPSPHQPVPINKNDFGVKHANKGRTKRSRG